MKRIAILVVFSLAVFSVKAQKLKIGFQNSLVLYGATSGNNLVYEESDFYQASAGGLMPTYRTGLTLQYPIIKYLGLESGLLVDLMGYRFSQKSTTTTEDFHGNVLSLNLKVPLLAYYKILMKSGGSFFVGGGFNFNFALSGLYRYRLGGQLHSYIPISDFSSRVNTYSSGYQVVLGLEDSEYSQFRISYGSNLGSFTRNSVNSITPFYLSFSIIARLN